MTQAKFTRRNCFTVLCLATFLVPANLLAAEAKRKPNIVYILADDLGYVLTGVLLDQQDRLSRDIGQCGLQ